MKRFSEIAPVIVCLTLAFGAVLAAAGGCSCSHDEPRHVTITGQLVEAGEAQAKHKVACQPRDLFLATEDDELIRLVMKPRLREDIAPLIGTGRVVCVHGRPLGQVDGYSVESFEAYSISKDGCRAD